MVLIWLFYPATYDYGTALNDSHYFYRTQRVGVLPDTSVPWRSNSLLQEYAIPFQTKDWDFGGGWMTVRLPASCCESPVSMTHCWKRLHPANVSASKLSAKLASLHSISYA